MTTVAIAYSALCIAVFGSLWRFGRWFWIQIGPENQEAPTLRGVARNLAAVLKAVSAFGLRRPLRSLIMDTLFQVRLLKQDWRRWVMHTALFYGLILLVVHGLDVMASTRRCLNNCASHR